jgi:DNA-binding transcriptional ArsR family regulator
MKRRIDMAGKEDKNVAESGDGTEEDEVFKSLSHTTRRQIIKAVGLNGSMSFSEILKNIGEIDSPSLSYHLKSLKVLLITDGAKYKLTKIGNSAYNLLEKTDESGRLKKGKRRFIYAFIVTLASWYATGFLVSLAAGLPAIDVRINTLITIICVVAGIDMFVLGMLKDKF